MTWSEYIAVTWTKGNIIGVSIFVIVIGIIMTLIILQLRHTRQDITIPSTIGTTWLNVPVFKSYWAPSFLPSAFSIGHNSMNPLLIVYDDRIKMRSMIFTYTRTWNDIKKINIDDSIFGKSIVFYLQSWGIETFNLMNKNNSEQLVEFLRKKWVTIE